MATVRALYERQIYVQPGSNWGMPTFVRVSVGASRDLEAFLDAVRDLGRGGA